MKEISVAFVSEKLKSDFEKLNDKQLYKFIKRAIDDLKQNPFCGVRIRKKLWPKIYIIKYGTTNLRKYDMPKGWRIIYTIESDDVRIVNIILEWFNHKEYQKTMGHPTLKCGV